MFLLCLKLASEEREWEECADCVVIPPALIDTDTCLHDTTSAIIVFRLNRSTIIPNFSYGRMCSVRTPGQGQDLRRGCRAASDVVDVLSDGIARASREHPSSAAR